MQLPDTYLPALAMAALAIVIMLYLKRYHPRLPGILVAVMITTLLSYLLGFSASGGKVVGQIPARLPAFSLPELDLAMLSSLLDSTMVITLAGFMEAISIAKAMATRTRERIDPNQELNGQGLTNIVGSLSNPILSAAPSHVRPST